jgi:uncharacterized membrane protein YeaQ/YmgE (transglycosylase-associated protein family)
MFPLIALLVIAAACGALGARLAGGGPKGCLASIAVGFIGALLGSWLARATGIGDLLPLNVAGRQFPVVWSIAGAALFVAVLTLLTRRKHQG